MGPDDRFVLAVAALNTICAKIGATPLDVLDACLHLHKEHLAQVLAGRPAQTPSGLVVPPGAMAPRLVEEAV